MKYYYLIDNLKELLELINNYLKPKDVENNLKLYFSNNFNK